MNIGSQKVSPKKIKIAVGVSGGGRSLANLIEKRASNNFEIALVFSSGQDLPANQIARESGIPLLPLDFGKEVRAVAAERLYEECSSRGIDLIVLAGFLKLLPVDPDWRGKIINIHPALLPKFGGKGMHGRRVHEAVIAAGDKTSGATVHFVDENYDEGDSIARVFVEVPTAGSPADLAEKVFEAEKALLPAVISGIATGELPARGVKDFKWTGGGLL